MVGLGEGQGEAIGDGWWEPPRILWGSPSTTSPLWSPFTFSDGAVLLCSVFSGLESVEEEDDDDKDEEEVVEEDSVQVGNLTGVSSAAKETLKENKKKQYRKSLFRYYPSFQAPVRTLSFQMFDGSLFLVAGTIIQDSI